MIFEVASDNGSVMSFSSLCQVLSSLRHVPSLVGEKEYFAFEKLDVVARTCMDDVSFWAACLFIDIFFQTNTRFFVESN